MKSKPQLTDINVNDSSSMAAVDNTLQGYKQALNDFVDKDGDKLPDELEQFLLYVAKTGDTLCTWEKVQRVFIQKMKLVVDEFYENHPYKDGKINPNFENDPYNEMKERLIQLAEKFESPPFTIQRLCELVTTPQKNYTKCEKFMRALEKNLMVVTSWTYPSRRTSDANEQINGGLQSRAVFATVETRPWSSLPHSPIATSAPCSRISLNPEESSSLDVDHGRSTPKLSGEVKTEEKDRVAVDEIEADAATSAESAAAQDSATEIDPTADSESLSSESSDSVKPVEQSTEMDSKVSGDSASILLTNTEKDALKEPLPGVGTLVEKHSTKPNPCEATATLAQVPGKPESESAESLRPCPSPKRKPDDDLPADVALAAKRRKSTDGDVEMTNLDGGNA